MWLVPRSARLNAVEVEPSRSKFNLKNLECGFGVTCGGSEGLSLNCVTFSFATLSLAGV